MPNDFYNAEANLLNASGVYKLWFPNYSVYTGNADLDTRKILLIHFQ
jgi:hypothetical protein